MIPSDIMRSRCCFNEIHVACVIKCDRIGWVNPLYVLTMSLGHFILHRHRHNGLPSCSGQHIMILCHTKFIPQFRNTILDHANLHEAQALVVHHDRHALYAPLRPHLGRDRRILHSSLADQICSHDHCGFIHIGTLLNDTVLVQLGIIQTRTKLSPLRNLGWVTKPHLRMGLLIILFKCLVGAKRHGTKHASLNGVFVHYNTVFLIVS